MTIIFLKTPATKYCHLEILKAFKMRLYFIFFAFVTAFAVAACSKSNNLSTVAAVNIINVSPSSPSIYINFWGSPAEYYTLPIAYYGSSTLFSIPAQNANLSLIIDTTSKPFFNGAFTLRPGQIWSLFLSGLSGVPDTLLVRDNIPILTPADSLTGVRFVNLVQGGNPISIDIQGTSGQIANNLPYKGVEDFQTFSANSTANNEGYVFEFRDAISDSLLASTPLNIVRNKSQTLVFYGSASAGLSILSVNNY